ncbi:hypothetical protein C8Q74DRAFT_1250392 [Fomes fomentarius]|nr:hypothetical protein C8Q74DRAFT_1250392 [Fomes fomentarius]
MDDSCEIRTIGFKAVVDDFYNRLQEGKVYSISRAIVGLAKKKFSNVNNDSESRAQYRDRRGIATCGKIFPSPYV